VGRSDLRRRWRTYAGIAVLLGLVGGLSLFAIAGARRTQSSFTRFARAANVSTLIVTSNMGYDPTTAVSLPQVVQSRTFVGLQVNVLVDGRPDFAQALEGVGTLDGEYFDQDRFTATSGRRPNADRADEVAFDEVAAERYGYHVGQQLQLGTYDFTEQDDAFYANPTPPKVTTAVTVVGIGVFPDEVVQDEGDRLPRLLLTPAFTRASAAYITYSLQGLLLANGDADIPAVKADVRGRFPDANVEYRVASDDAARALKAVRPLALALAMFGVVVGVAGLVLVGQATARALRAQREERVALRAIGTPPRVTLLAALAGPALSIIVGTALAIGFAVVASPLMPTGPVGRVEASPGVSVDTTVLGLGALLIVIVLVVAGLVVAWLEAPQRVAQRERRVLRPGFVVGQAASAGMSPPAVTGLRFAFERQGASSMRSVMVGGIVAVVALVGAITFGVSFSNLVDHPRLYGWSGDAIITAANGYGNVPRDEANAILQADPQVETWSGVFFGGDVIDGVATPMLGMDPGASLVPPVLRGRAIERADEIVLGGATAAALDKDIGDEVTIGGGGTPRMVRVVGIATFPAIGAVHVAHTALGTGALVVPELVPNHDLNLTGTERGDFGPRAIFVRLRPGIDVDAELAHLRETTAPLSTSAGLDVLSVQRPAEIVTGRAATSLPVFLAGTLAVATLASLGLALANATRRRRRELALLRTIGFTGRQLGAVVSWLATATVVIGLAVGVPLGIVVGRLTWQAFADQLDVVHTPRVPLVTIVLLVIVAVALANAIAAAPARRARQVATASLLRPE
jgi:ABC-type lipoprotein release transport system permease subunit